MSSLARGTDLHTEASLDPALSAMPDGQGPVPGGWNRIQIEVDNLVATVEKLRGAGCRFRNEIVIGNGGKQILLDDPSGNPIELFQPA